MFTDVFLSCVLFQVLKLSKTFVDTITTEVLPPITVVFKERVEVSVKLFKCFQKPCRYLQRLCTFFRDDLKDEKLAGCVSFSFLHGALPTWWGRVEDQFVSCGVSIVSGPD